MWDSAAIPVESAAVMDPADGVEPPIWDEFRSLLVEARADVKLERLGRFTFYDAAASPDVALTVATAEQRIYANLLLTIGVVT